MTAIGRSTTAAFGLQTRSLVATPDLDNALNVSYLEHLDFDGPRGPAAWERLTPRLKVGWKEMQRYLEALAAKGRPRKWR